MEFGVLMIGVIAFIYFLPTIVAVAKGCPNSGAIFLIDLLFGWSVVGWIAALIWASVDSRKPQFHPPAAPASNPREIAVQDAPMPASDQSADTTTSSGVSTGVVLAIVVGCSAVALTAGIFLGGAFGKPSGSDNDAAAAVPAANQAPGGSDETTTADAATDTGGSAPEANAASSNSNAIGPRAGVVVFKDTVLAVTPCPNGGVSLHIGGDARTQCDATLFADVNVGDRINFQIKQVSKDRQGVWLGLSDVGKMTPQDDASSTESNLPTLAGSDIATATAITPCGDDEVEITLNETDRTFTTECNGAALLELKVGDVVALHPVTDANAATLQFTLISRPGNS